jgi:tRNA-Thr(GGU) m(6)t(6)A37 methyltransferase TsaA
MRYHKEDVMEIVYRPIGTIHTPYTAAAGMPIQPAGAQGVRGSIAIAPQFGEGLRDLDGFSHLILLYHFHRARTPKLTATPFLDDRPRGVFATRAPTRPNPIGLSIVKLMAVDGLTLTVENVDVLDGTPLLDIKPYVPAFDHQPADRVGWLAASGSRVRRKKADRRFVR